MKWRYGFMLMVNKEPTDRELHEALFGLKKGARYKVAPKEERTWNGIVFDSKHEMEQYVNFVRLEKAGTIRELKRQVRYKLDVNGFHVCDYVADWTCMDLEGRICVYDAKGHKTETYTLKRKLFHACYPALRIVEL